MSRLMILLVLFIPCAVSAHQPLFPPFTNYDDTYLVEDVTTSQAFYGELIGFPHTYRLDIKDDQTLKVEILVPDIEEATNDKSSIIVHEVEPGIVKEVTRLPYTAGSWESFYEPFGGDSYRLGPTYSGELTAGSYLLEVGTAENQGKYVLVIGELETFKGVGYFDLLGRIYQVKQFFGKSPFAVLQSPFYTVPLSLLLICGFLLYRKYKRSHA